MIQTRIARLRAELRRRKLDAVLILSPPHIRYLTNFSGSNGCCLVRPQSVILYTDSRYAIQAPQQMRNHARCVIGPGHPVENAVRSIGRPGIRIGFEADHLPVRQFRRLKRNSPGVRFVAVSSLIEPLLAVKEPEEIKRIKKAVGISISVFRNILRLIRPGMTEIDIAAEISYLQRRKGAERDAFDPIVVSSRRSALPHATPTGRKIREGDHLLLDFGCMVGGYHSDITRTISIGKPAARFRKLYEVVLEARRQALHVIRPGVRVSAVDGAARKALETFGLAKYFTHSLGHGLGLSVHEEPRLAPLARGILEAGNVITVEPGIYIPSFGGIRVEDDVLVTRNGFSLLSRAEDQLIVV